MASVLRHTPPRQPASQVQQHIAALHHGTEGTLTRPLTRPVARVVPELGLLALPYRLQYAYDVHTDGKVPLAALLCGSDRLQFDKAACEAAAL